MKWTLHLVLAAVIAVVLADSSVRATILMVDADVEVGERPEQDRGSNGTQINIRTFERDDPAPDRNELIALRFDLTGIDFSNYNVATLNLTHFRNNGSQRYYSVYGVNSGAIGADPPGWDGTNWEESSVVMSTMPGLIYDGDAATQGIDPLDTTHLGGGRFSDALEGDVEVIDVAGLFSFLANHADDLVTILIARDLDLTPGSTGQDRFASKEAFETETGVRQCPDGSCGPFMEFSFSDAPGGDFDGDGTIDGHDFLFWQRDPGVGDLAEWELGFGTTSLASAAVAVPEPATGVVGLAMLLALASCRARRVA